MTNLIAYIPALNQRHLDWFKKHSNGDLYLIPQEMAQSLLPRLSRNLAAVPTLVQISSIRSLPDPWKVWQVLKFDPINHEPFLGRPAGWGEPWILPDEDISHAVVEKYFTSTRAEAKFENIRARWDMTAVKRRSPIMAGVDVITGHNLRMEFARKEAAKSPDWWRRIGAALYVNGHCMAVGCNDHYPTEYEQDIKGDPRGNFEAGQPGKYLSFHAEKTVIAKCANAGIATKGAILYTTVFPCEDCARAIVVAGIDHVFFEEGYSTLDAQEVLRGAGVQITQVVKKDPESA
ncbi:MAG: deaminase [Patescibacteria group bacterium]